MAQKLSDLCYFFDGRVAVADLGLGAYVSTENMLPNKDGITRSAGLPTVRWAQAYQADDVLVSNIRPYFRKIWLADHNGGCSNDVLVLRAKEGCNPVFLYYLLSDDNFFAHATATAKGTKMPRGDKDAIMQYEVPDFPLHIQIRIGKVLSALDARIANNTKINHHLEQVAQAIFKSWFVDFEPWGGEMPSEWREGTISDLGDVIGGSTPSKTKPEYYTEHGVAWITPKDLSVNKSKFIAHGADDITELGLHNSSARLMPRGTVLFSSRAPIGYSAIASGEVCTNQGFKSIVPKENVGTAFVYYFLRENLQAIENMASGSTFKEVSRTTMKNIPAVIPDEDILRHFQDDCAPLFEKQEILESENARLATLRDTLLPRLMSGEIAVDNA
jgi:type I restriction enzyme S subunit